MHDTDLMLAWCHLRLPIRYFFFEIKLFVFLRVNRKAFFASIEQIFERRSSRQWKDVQAKEYPSSIMDETPVRGNWSAHMPRPQSKICLKKRKHSLRARQIFKPQRLRKDFASKIPAIHRFKEKQDCGCRAHVCICSGRTCITPGNAVQRTNL